MEGLTAQDRQDWEKLYSDQMKGFTPELTDRLYKNFLFKQKFGNREDYGTLKQLSPELRDSLLTLEIDFQLPESKDSTLALTDLIQLTLRAAEPVKLRTDELYERYSTYPGESRKELDNFDKIATLVSPYYKRYKNTEYLPLNDEDKLLIMADYNAARAAYGDEEANTRLRIRMLDTASQNQSTWEKYWNGFRGMGALTAGALIGTAGMIKGAIDYIGDESNPNLNPVEDFLDHVIDNSWTRYGNDIMQYGSLFDASILYAKLNGDFSNIPIIRTTLEELGDILDNILSENTIPELINQQGFTIASMLSGAGLSAISNKAFQGLRGAAIAANRAGTLNNLLKVNTVLLGLLRAQQSANAFVIPALVGTVEGVSEGLNTKILFLDDAKEQISLMQAKAIESEISKRLENPELLIKDGYDPSNSDDLARLYKDIFDSYSTKYEDAVDRAETNAAKAGIYNMGLNSVINGALNMTLKAGLQTPSVQEAMRRSRVGRLFNSADFKISNSGQVTPSYGKLKRVSNVLLEPFGEFSEEYLLSVSDAFARGGAEYDLHNYIENKYTGDGKDAVDSSILDNLVAAASAAGDAAIDKETILSGIYGALSSGIGTPTINNRRGPANRMQDESSLEYALRRSPVTYRNPIYEAIKELREIYEDKSTASGVINEWVKDPDNRSKYDGIVGTFNWAQRMDKSSQDNDEFAYRNSELGKTINDVMMLEQLLGTSYYDSFVNDLVRSANVEEESPEAQSLILLFKNAPNNRDIDLSDEQILLTIRHNSETLLNTMSKIKEESNRLDKTLGNAANQDTKQALIFGKLQMDDWAERSKQLENDLLINMPASSYSNYDEASLPELIKYGDVGIAKRQQVKYYDLISKLKLDIKVIESRLNVVGDKERAILKLKKATIKTLEKEIKRVDKLQVPDLAAPFILNETSIMSLDPVDRATILNPENIDRYSEELLGIINNVIRYGTSSDPDFLNKIQDAGRISLAQQSYLTQYNDVLSSPDSFNAFSNRIRQLVELDNVRRKYQYLGSILDYPLFIKDLNRAYETSSVLERLIIKDVLEDNELYKRYIDNNKTLEGVFDQLEGNEKFLGLSNNDRNVLMAAMQYLSDKGIDVMDSNVRGILLDETDGVSELSSYVDHLNGRLPKDLQIKLPSLVEVADLLDSTLHEHVKNVKDVEVVNKPVLAQPTPASMSKPPVEVKVKEPRQDELPKVSLLKAPLGKPATLATNIFDLLTEDPSLLGAPDPIVGKFNTNSNAEVSSAAATILLAIDNAQQIYDDVKLLAKDLIDILGDSEYEDAKDLVEEIVTRANTLQVQSLHGGDSFDKLSSLLKHATSKVKVTLSNIQPIKELDNETERIRNNGLITTASVYRYPNSTVGKAYIDYKIEEFLRKGTLTPKTPILFVNDPAITNSVRLEMGDVYNLEDHLPILAVVENSNGPIELEGKKYLPVGFLPRSSANTQGAARTMQLRKLAILLQGIIKDDLGVVITSNGYVRANPPEHTKAGTPNTPILTIMINDMSLLDRDMINNTSIPEETRLAIYRKYRNNIIKGIRRVKSAGKNLRIHLSYVTSNMKGGETEFELYVSSPLDTNTREGQPIAQVLLEGTPGLIINSNSRLHRYSNTLEEFFKKNPFGGDINFKRDRGVLVAVGEGLDKLNNLGDSITKKLSNFISLPKGYMYTFTPTELMLGDRRLYQFSATDGVDNIPLALVTDGLITDDTKVQIIRSLMLDNGNFRLSGTQPFAKWLVNYNDFVEKEGEDKQIKNIRLSNVRQIFDDNILGASRTSFKYSVRGVDINSPLKGDGTRAFKTPIVSNLVNATLGRPINTPVIVATDQVKSGYAIIDSETGVILGGEPELVPSAILLAREVVSRIELDSKSITLTDDQSGYVDRDGVRYARVTSIIQADENAGDRFDPNSPWVVPSTNIGTGVDEFVRDFFAGKFFDDNGGISSDYHFDYPNATQRLWKEFATQLLTLKNHIDSRGLTIIPRDITAAGSITITDNLGLTHTINVAGTLDLFAYDQKGEFHIFDMKTVRSNIDEHKMKKYSRQVSLYKRFLEDKYNIRVASLNIIPIKVSYPTPKGANGTADYTIESGNQLLLNGREYKGSEPNLLEVGTVLYTEVNIQYDKLTAGEMEMITSTLPEGAVPNRILVSEPEAKVDTKSGLKRGRTVNRFSRNLKAKELVSPSYNNWALLDQEIKGKAIALGYTKESWDSMTLEEKFHLIECLK